MREAFSRHDGVEVDTQGDAFFFAFPTAPGATLRRRERTEALASGPIQVRVGLHTGTPLLTDEGYVGADVHRALASPLRGTEDRWSWRLRQPSSSRSPCRPRRTPAQGFSAPSVSTNLETGSFPPLRALYLTQPPIPSTPFVERERELAAVLELLVREDVRLLTLTGPGGTGKTRLAVQVAAEAAEDLDGVWWIPLATLRDAALVVEQAAQALGAKGELDAHIGDKRLLLLFDNFEQVVRAATGCRRARRRLPQADVLVTSREPLHVAGEQEYPVPPLLEAEALLLFQARAQAAVPDFRANAAITEICRRLDNLPLAIELAAARVTALSPEQILERLEKRLALLTGGPQTSRSASRRCARQSTGATSCSPRTSDASSPGCAVFARRLHARGG